MIRRFFPRKCYVEGQRKVPQLSQIRINVLLVFKSFRPLPIRRSETGARIQNTVLLQRVLFSFLQSLRKKIFHCFDRISLNYRHFSRILTRQKRDNNRYVKIRRDFPHPFRLHPIRSINNIGSSLKCTLNDFRTPRVNGNFHSKFRHRINNCVHTEPFSFPIDYLSIISGSLTPNVNTISPIRYQASTPIKSVRFGCDNRFRFQRIRTGVNYSVNEHRAKTNKKSSFRCAK
ncbi:MAG: Uncharacterised protein [Acidimicrobiaceae bacterium]|nr:MAG: Uncharacterised protein [Acidimicrobiaceae bacterium]